MKKNLFSIFIALNLFTFNITASEIESSEEKAIQEIIKEDQSRTSQEQIATENVPLETPKDKFAAVVQYAEGKPYIRGTKKTYLNFKDLIKFNETIIIPKNEARLKIVTEKRCVVVLYSNTKAIAPKTKDGSWIIEQGSVRWICPENRTETVEYKKSKIEIIGGEVLISKNQLVTLKPKVNALLNNVSEQELAFENIYLLKSNKWVSALKQKDAYELYNYEKNYPSPVESSRKDLNSPIDPKVTRVYLGIAPIGLGGVYHHEKDNKLSDFSMQSFALKLGVNFPYKNKSILTFLEWGDSENKDKRESKMFFLPVGHKALRHEYLFAGLGLRHSHKKSSSYYYFAGLAYQRLEFSVKPDAFSDFHGSLKNYLNIGAGAGYQKIFFPKKWYSLILGGELKVLQTLTQGELHNFHQSFGSDIDPKSMYTNAIAHIYIAPAINF